jgi:K+-sensing histidine kinase KdpD
MFSASFGGFGPGLFSIILTFLAFDYYYVTAIHTLSIDVKEILRILVFSIATLFTGLLSPDFSHRVGAAGL